LNQRQRQPCAFDPQPQGLPHAQRCGSGWAFGVAVVAGWQPQVQPAPGQAKQRH
jgi:hypothetical protein